MNLHTNLDLTTANALQLSKASVTSYLPYKKGVYFPSTAEKEKISVGAGRQQRYRAMKRWSSVLLALKNIKKVGEVVDRPKALGDIRGVTYIYGVFYRFGLIDVPDDAKEKMGHPQNRKK
jgi:hypothetical protein